jgi:hypothetical protein
MFTHLKGYYRIRNSHKKNQTRANTKICIKLYKEIREAEFLTHIAQKNKFFTFF